MKGKGVVGKVAWVFCKVWEHLLRALSPAGSDPTKILLDSYTLAQSEAQETPPADIPVTGRVLVVVPFRDRWQLTARCLESLLRQELPECCKFEIALVDNGSVEPYTADGVRSFITLASSKHIKAHHLRVDAPFNFSALNNAAVQRFAAGAPWYLFLNNDVEFRSSAALARLLAGAAAAPRSGAVGCTLLYPSGAIQHLFVAPGVKIVAAHPLKGAILTDAAAWFAAPRPVAAVTGAALLVRAPDFHAVDGFDEALPTVGQDVDLCLKLQKLGRTNWVIPDVRLIHHEGASRGQAIAEDEVARIYAKWGDFLHFNPYYDRRLSRFSEPPIRSPLALRYPWRLVIGP